MINCMIDPKQFKKKPGTEEYRSDKVGYTNTIDYRIRKSPFHQLTNEELARHLERGQVVLPGHLVDREGGRKKGVRNINTFSLDIDNDKETKYTKKEVIKKIEGLLDVTPFIYYETFTGINKDGSKRFRLMYKINEVISVDKFEMLMQYIMDSTGDMLDTSCKKANDLFNGTNREVFVYDDYKTLDTKVVDKLVLEEEKRREKLAQEREQEVAENKERRKAMGYDLNYSENVIEEINRQDMSQYLYSEGYQLDRTNRMKCPLHNGGNPTSFSINNSTGTWLYHCFSGRCGRSGNLIQLHQELNNLDFKEALEELKKRYNIQEQPRPRTPQIASTGDIVCRIDKYIGQDKKATETIIDAINKNQKVLITGAMACGKTTFVVKDIRKYAKALGKVVIMIIPGVKQLEYLNDNQGVSIVYEKSPEYMGTDLVATTPESLPKITKEVGQGNYILVTDESHERYTSLYRHGYRDKNIETAEQDAFKSIHMTATPRLLVHDNFDKVINIGTEKSISNDITIFKVKDKLDDNMLSMVNKTVKAKRQPILFNNNKEMNKAFSELIETKEKVIAAEFKEGQLNLLKADDPIYRTEEKTIISTETIQSGKKSESVAKGQIVADSTFTTSSITAGVDLYARDNATLIINTDGVGLDSVIQLIGRFRDGINVIIIIPDNENKRECFNLYNATTQRISDSKEVARIMNNSKAMQRLSESNNGIKESARLELNDIGTWVVNEARVIADVYEEWSRAVYDNPKELIELLKEQTAFTVNDIGVAKFNDEKENRISELKKVSKEKQKEIREATSKELLNKSDETLQQLFTKDHQDLEEKDIELFNKHVSVTSDRHLEQINLTADKLFTNENGVKNLATAFRKFQGQSWASIQREIAEVEAREINRLIKEHGVKPYLEVKNLRHKRSVDVVQAKIRYELRDLEKKQGRLSNKKFDKLVKLLIAENYIYNKNVRAYKDKDTTEKDKEKAFQSIGQDIGKLVKNIYNFKSDGQRISSIKD